MNSIYKRLKHLNDKYNRSNLIFLLFGLVAFIWFLVRVIPKPSRATYPCIKVTAPLASGFVVYLLGLAGSILAFYKAKTSFENRKRFTGIFALLVLLAVFWQIFRTAWQIFYTSSDPFFRTWAGFFILALVWILGYSLFDIVLLNDKVLLFFIANLGILYAAKSSLSFNKSS